LRFILLSLIENDEGIKVINDIASGSTSVSLLIFLFSIIYNWYLLLSFSIIYGLLFKIFNYI